MAAPMKDKLNLLPKYDVTFQKKGLEPHEWEKCLISKVSNVIGDRLNHVTSDEVKNAINELKKDVCIRENITRPGLDQRSPRAIKNLSQQGMLTSPQEPVESEESVELKERVKSEEPKEQFKEPVEPKETKEPEKPQQPEESKEEKPPLKPKREMNLLTPTQEKELTSGIRGTKRADRKRIDDYHDEQHRLFSEEHLLGKKFSNLFLYIEDNKGFFIDLSDNERFSGEDACRVIDKFTDEFIVYLIRLMQNQAAPNEWEPKNICDIRSKCFSILSGRRVVAWANPNNLMDLREYKEWKAHISIEMSYAALIVVLDLIQKKLQVPTAI